MIGIVKNRSKPAGTQVRGQAPVPQSLSRSEMTGPFTTTTALLGSYSLIHSFDNYARGTVAGPARRAPAPAPEHPQPPGAALRRQHSPDAAARAPPRRARNQPDRGLGSTRAPTPPALPAARPPASAPLRHLRPPGSCGEGGARRGGPPPGVQGNPARATPGPEGLGGWVGPTGHSPPPGQNRGACSKPFETAWAAAHPAVSSLFIGSRRTAHRPFIGPFERTVGTRRPQL